MSSSTRLWTRSIGSMDGSTRSRLSSGESALRGGGRRSAPGDPRPFAGRPDRDQGQPRRRGDAARRWARDLFARRRPADRRLLRAPAAGRRVRDRRQDRACRRSGSCRRPSRGAFGPTAQPVGPEPQPGGSSGGAAAAVAAGLAPIAHATDGGGSIRQPAALNGLFGLKPSRGRVSVGPDAGQSFLAGDGVLTRTVADTAAVLDVLAGYELGRRDLGAAGRGRRVRVGRGRGALAGRAADRAGAEHAAGRGGRSTRSARAAARDAAALLESLGHEIEEVVQPSLRSGPDLLSTIHRRLRAQPSRWSPMIGGQLAGREPQGVRRRAADLADVGARPRSWLGPPPWPPNCACRPLARARRGRVSQLRRTCSPRRSEQRPAAIGHVHGRGPVRRRNYLRSAEFTPYTATLNVTGQPAISLPLYHGEDGLPTAVQLIGRPAREDTLLALATQLQSAAAVEAEHRRPLAAGLNLGGGLRAPAARASAPRPRAPRVPRPSGMQNAPNPSVPGRFGAQRSSDLTSAPNPPPAAGFGAGRMGLSRCRAPRASASGRPRAARRRRCRGGRSRDLEQFGLVPGRERRRAHRAARPPSAARRVSRRDPTSRRWRPKRAAISTIWRVGERLRSGQLIPAAVGLVPAAPPGSAAITQSATSSAQIG